MMIYDFSVDLVLNICMNDNICNITISSFVTEFDKDDVMSPKLQSLFQD